MAVYRFDLPEFQVDCSIVESFARNCFMLGYVPAKRFSKLSHTQSWSLGWFALLANSSFGHILTRRDLGFRLTQHCID